MWLCSLSVKVLINVNKHKNFIKFIHIRNLYCRFNRNRYTGTYCPGMAKVSESSGVTSYISGGQRDIVQIPPGILEELMLPRIAEGKIFTTQRGLYNFVDLRENSQMK